MLDNNARITLPVLLLLTLFLSACGGGGGGDDPPDPEFGSGGGSGSFTPKPSDETPNPGDGDVIIEEPPQLDDIVVTSGNISVLVPGSSLLEVIDVAVGTAPLPDALPVGFTLVGDPVQVDISEEDQALLNGPVEVTVTYSDQGVNFENNLVVLGHNGASYEPLTILERDPAANTITFDSRRIYPYVVAEMDDIVPAVHDTGFIPSVNGWDLTNSGTYFAPGGNSFGMAGYAAWFYDNGAQPLNGLYLEQTARFTAARVQMSQAETWGRQPWRTRQSFTDPDLARLLHTFISEFNRPLVLLLGEGAPSLAVTVYGFDAGGFFFYDPEVPDTARYVTFDGSVFGTYGDLSVLGYAALPSYGRDADFSALADEATAGFPGSDNISIATPQPNAQIDAREATFSGSFLNDLSTEEDLYVEVKGVGRQLPVTNGTYSNIIEISSGINTIVALAGVDSSVENNWFRDAPMAILEVEGTLPPAQLLVTLTWEQDETDVDLYIIEPGGEAMWFGNPQTSNGLELDFDDTTGFGPEHGTLEAGGTDEALAGNYRVRVHYFSDDGLGVAATGRVSIVINEGREDQNTLSLRFRINTDDASASGPDGSGDSWVDIATVDVLENVIDADGDGGFSGQ